MVKNKNSMCDKLLDKWNVVGKSMSIPSEMCVCVFVIYGEPFCCRSGDQRPVPRQQNLKSEAELLLHNDSPNKDQGQLWKCVCGWIKVFLVTRRPQGIKTHSVALLTTPRAQTHKHTHSDALAGRRNVRTISPTCVPSQRWKTPVSSFYMSAASQKYVDESESRENLQHMNSTWNQLNECQDVCGWFHQRLLCYPYCAWRDPRWISLYSKGFTAGQKWGQMMEDYVENVKKIMWTQAMALKEAILVVLKPVFGGFQWRWQYVLVYSWKPDISLTKIISIKEVNPETICVY